MFIFGSTVSKYHLSTQLYVFELLSLHSFQTFAVNIYNRQLYILSGARSGTMEPSSGVVQLCDG